jgi:hypothetical protein
MVFLCLLIGNLLVNYTAVEIYLFLGSIFKDQSSVTTRLVLFLAPLLLTALFLKGSLARSKVLLEILPAVLSGLTAVILLYPILPALQSSLAGNGIWKVIDQYRSFIVIAASVSVLLDVWFLYPRAHGLKHKR